MPVGTARKILMLSFFFNCRFQLKTSTEEKRLWGLAG